jgi:Bacterial regulatory helix-turn-helix protein, lysR family
VAEEGSFSNAAERRLHTAQPSLSRQIRDLELEVGAKLLENSSGLTLDGGSFSVMEEETFAGEGIFEPIRPGEKRLVSYAADLALNASSRIGSEQQRVTRVHVSRGVMMHDSEVRERKTTPSATKTLRRGS